MITLNNFRDLGTLSVGDKKIKDGMIYRSSVLFPKNDEDREFIEKVKPDIIFDFRCPEEVADKPDFVPSGVKYRNIPVFDGDCYRHITVSKIAKLRSAVLHGKRSEIILREKLQSYREMPFAKCYNEIFNAMDEGKSFIFHCTEGKDRTGICDAIIEYCLGRMYDEILTEYLKSNVYRPAKDRHKYVYFGASKTMLGFAAYAETTHEELLEISINAAIKRYGSVDNYLYEMFGITEDRKKLWQKLYLE